MKLKHIPFVLMCLLFARCTKLDQKLNDSFAIGTTGAADVNALLNSAYNANERLLFDNARIFNLQETTTDEALVPTRGGDWDDNGVFRVLHRHTWIPIHVGFKGTFNQLGGLQQSATTVLAFKPNTLQRAEALFLRSFAQFWILDMWGQVPYRPYTAYNSIDPAPVLSPPEAVDTLVATLTSIIPDLADSIRPYRAGPDAARFLLMKVLLNKGAFINKSAPTFDPADMQSVIDIGEEIINSGKYSLTPKYFDNFGPNNIVTGKGEMIFGWPNFGTSERNGIIRGEVQQRWMMTLHYNSWTGKAGSAGWNGFSTMAEFYNTFDEGDTRLGGEPYPGVTDVSGLKPGFLVGQQVNKDGTPQKDRQGNPLSFTPEVSLIETQKDRIEVAGIRVVKYPPDYAAYDGGNATNQLQIFRYADVILMVAEAYARLGDMGTATTMVNQLRAVRSAAPITGLTIVNDADIYDKNTLLAERGRELYWENWRRQDLIRFGMFLKPFALKEADADGDKNLLFPFLLTNFLQTPTLFRTQATNMRSRSRGVVGGPSRASVGGPGPYGPGYSYTAPFWAIIIQCILHVLMVARRAVYV